MKFNPMDFTISMLSAAAMLFDQVQEPRPAAATVPMENPYCSCKRRGGPLDIHGLQLPSL